MRVEELYTNYLKGAFPLVVIDTVEDVRASNMVKSCVDALNKDIFNGKYDMKSGFNLYEYDAHRGIVFSLTEKRQEGTVQLRRALEWIEEQTDPAVIIMYDFHTYFRDAIGNVSLVPAFKNLCRHMPKQNIQIVGIGNVSQIPDELRDYITPLEFGYPTKSEIYQQVMKLLYDEEIGYFTDEKHKPAFKEKLCKEIALASVGMTANEIESAVKLAMVSPNVSKSKPIDLQLIYEAKARNITASGLLEYVNVEEDIDSLGGMENFKEWVDNYIEKIFKDPERAKAFGLKMPKGVILTGVQGTGKSLAAKWLSKKLDVKCYLCDFGRVFGSLLGESERNMRTLLKQIKAVSPAVIILEEIEKSLSGQDSSNYTDGGVTARLIGSLLYDLSENTDSLSFKVATANDVFKLPPELLRSGRWDSIYFFDVPSQRELEEIYRIHIRKTGRDPEKFAVKEFASKSKGFIGAEVENAVQLALRKAFTIGSELTNELILEEIANTKPLTVVKKDEIDRLREWAKDKATLANRKEETQAQVVNRVTQPLIAKKSKAVH